MNGPSRFVAVLLMAVSIAIGIVGFVLPEGYVQSICGNGATELFGLAIALFLVNHYLGASEKAEAAAPLVKLITPAIEELHNKLFIRHFNHHFGIDKTKDLVGIYERNRRDPKAFSPAQRDEIHAAIMMKRDDLLRVFDVLIDQFREISMITGWSFDPEVTAAALEARLNFVKFKSMHVATDDESKRQLIEAYLDGEAAASAVVERLIERLGWPRDKWQRAI